MPDEIISIPLPASDWPVIQAALLELPGKFGIPVINRLNLALAEAQKPRVGSLKGENDG
jgi:hypothetical protein